MNMSRHSKGPRTSADGGFGTLISVMVVGAVAVAAAISLLLLGLGSSRSSSSLERMQQARALTDACAEEAMQRLRDDPSVTGTDSLSLGLGSCIFTIASVDATTKDIAATGTVGTSVRKVKVRLTPFVPPAARRWREVADF